MHYITSLSKTDYYSVSAIFVQIRLSSVGIIPNKDGLSSGGGKLQGMYWKFWDCFAGLGVIMTTIR